MKQSDAHRTILGPPLCGAEQRQLAYEFLVRNHQARRLPAVDGFEDPVAGYADVLGLNEEHMIERSTMVIKPLDGPVITVKPKRVKRVS